MALVEELSGRDGIEELAAARNRLGISTLGTTDVVADEWWRIASTNPSGAAVHLVVKQNGAIVAAASFVPKTFCHRGQETPVAEIGGTFTAPEAQGRGYFSSLVRELVARATELGLQALYGTPNEQSGRIYIDRLGWTPVEHWTRWIRPTSALLRLPLDLVSRALLGRFSRDATFSVLAPELRGDDLDASRAQRDHFVRNEAHIAWRYPSSRYSMIRCDVNNCGVAWCIAGRTTRLGQPAVAIADIGIRSGDEWAMRGMLREAARLFPSARLVFGATLRNGHYPIWRGLGALPRVSPMPIIAHSAADPNGAKLFGSMVFDIGDSDTV